jgi:hypothetical protein
VKILHIFDCSCVAECLAKNQRRLGHKVDVEKFGADFDGSGMDDCYGTTQVFRPDASSLYKYFKRVLPKNRKLRRILYKLWRIYPQLKFYLYVMRHYRGFDVLHIHMVWPVVFFTPFKKKIIEFHGDDVRHAPTLYSFGNRLATRFFVAALSKRIPIYVSTPDLLSDVKGAVWLPNPVDTDLFSPDKFNPTPRSALYCHNWYEDGNHAVEYANSHGLILTVLDRANQCWVKHDEFPSYLGGFEFFIDRVAIKSLSKTALEMLALGGKVVDWKGDVLEGLPDCHKPMNAAKLTIKIYEEVTKNV